MDMALCDISAFYFHRIPPCFRDPLVEGVELDDVLGKSKFGSGAHLRSLLPGELHVLVDSRRGRYRSCDIRRHILTNAPESGVFEEVVHGLPVTSPCYTLLFAARHLDCISLAMMMYEYVGSFSVFHCSEEQNELVLQALAQSPAIGSRDCRFGLWKPFINRSGRVSDIWTRPPLVAFSEMDRFIKQMRGVRGCEKLQSAWRLVFGAAASPFEAQLAMLLGASRSLGGEGLSGFKMNERVDFPMLSRRLSGHSYCVCDLFYENASGLRPLDIECHSAMAHDNAESFISDADRQLALEHMGIDCLLLTYGQMDDSLRFREVAQLIAKRLVKTYRPKTVRYECAERNLREKLLIDWNTLGLLDGSVRRRG